jgi:hypothetical protein
MSFVTRPSLRRHTSRSTPPSTVKMSRILAEDVVRYARLFNELISGRVEVVSRARRSYRAVVMPTEALLALGMLKLTSLIFAMDGGCYLCAGTCDRVWGTICLLTRTSATYKRQVPKRGGFQKFAKSENSGPVTRCIQQLFNGFGPVSTDVDDGVDAVVDSMLDDGSKGASQKRFPLSNADTTK